MNWILKARDIDAMIEQLHDMDTDGSVRNISEIQSLLENSTGYVKPRLHLEMRKLFFARCQQLVDAVDDAMNRAVFRSAQPCKPARISLAMAMLRGSILDSDPVSAVMIRNNFDGIIEDIAKVGGEAIKELVLQLAPNEGVVQGAEAAYLYHNTEVLLRECNNRKSDSGGGWIFLGRFGKYIFILIWAILLLSCLAFVLCCISRRHCAALR